MLRRSQGEKLLSGITWDSTIFAMGDAPVVTSGDGSMDWNCNIDQLDFFFSILIWSLVNLTPVQSLLNLNPNYPPKLPPLYTLLHKYLLQTGLWRKKVIELTRMDLIRRATISFTQWWTPDVIFEQSSGNRTVAVPVFFSIRIGFIWINPQFYKRLI